MVIVADVPALPDGLELIGEIAGSGYRAAPALVRRQDGQTLQLTPLLYAVLEAVDGRRTYAEIAEAASSRTGRQLTDTDVAKLVDTQLRPRGLLRQPDGSPPRLERSRPLTGLSLRFAVTDPSLTRRITAPFAILFNLWIWLPLVAIFAWVVWWLLMERGLASAAYHAFAKPDLLLVVLIVTVLSAGFHEFGHAAAARRGGAQPGAMGAGWLLLWPAFYTDVSDTYRLGRSARLRTDLGGLYFNAIIAVAIAAAWWLTGWDALLLIVAAQILQMVRQLAPLVRFDGYHVLADLTGVPDLFSRIGPILGSLWPTRWNDPRVAQLKWWTRLVVTVWVLVVVPLLLVSLIALVVAAPRLIGTALASLGREWEQALVHLDSGQYLDGIGAALAMAVIALPLVAIAVAFARTALGVVRRLWRGAGVSPIRRAGAGSLVVATGLALALAWWPDAERYEPIRPYEGGTLLSLAAAPLAAAGYEVAPAPPGDGGELVTVLPASGTLPTEADPEMALVLVPDEPRGDGSLSGATDAIEQGWVFPFNEPLPPDPGDNQAFAVNTTDSSVTYDVAIAMIWVTGEDPVLNTNESYAFASCTDCVTVSVAFQVVVIVGSADVIVPQNLSAALNYECFRCITAAIANQLVVTVESMPGAEQQIALADVWEEIVAFATTIPTLPLADVITELERYKEEIVAILGVAPPSDSIEASSASPATSNTAPPWNLPTPGATEGSPSASPMVTARPSPSGASTGSTIASPSESPSVTPSPSPTPTTSGGPSASP